VFLKENLETGCIRPSKSPMASLVFFIKKKDGSLQLVQDYRALNAITVKNKYPSPSSLNSLTNFKGLSTSLNLMSAEDLTMSA
jgi:hypothetical protein